MTKEFRISNDAPFLSSANEGEREKERERAVMDEDEEGKRERRSSALSTGPAY